MVEERGGGGAEQEGEEAELECGICCMPFDRCGRAPRRLGGARGSWKPSRCRHVLCSACVCQLAREGWWEQVTCPYCRAVTSLRERENFLVAGVRRGSGYGARRRLVLPPIDAELWHRVVRLEDERSRRQLACGDDAEASAPPEGAEEEEAEVGAAGQGRLWKALKSFLKRGRAGPQDDSTGAVVSRRRATLPARLDGPLNRECVPRSLPRGEVGLTTPAVGLTL